MKKLTKTQKQNIKTKVMKILNITSYILSALFVLILIISMCKGCDSKSINNNDHTSQQRRNNIIQYAINNNDSDYLLPITDTQNIRYGGTFDNRSQVITLLDTIVEETIEPFTNDVSIYLSLKGDFIDNVRRIIVNEENNMSQIRQYHLLDVNNNVVGVFDISYLVEISDVFFALYTYEDNVILKPFIINYLYIYLDGESNKDYEFSLPPYLRIDNNVKGFSIDISGYLNINDNNVVRFKRFEYAYHDSLYFFSVDNVMYQWELINIDSEGNYYFSYRTRIYSDIFLPGQQPYVYETYTTIPKIVFTSFGTLGYDFLSTYFLNNNNNIFGGDFFININYINNLIYNGDNTTNGYTTYNVHFRFKDVYYQSLTIYSNLNTTFTNSGFIIYFNLGSDFYVPTSRILLEYTPVTNQTLYKVSSELIDVEDDNYISNTVIYFEDNVLSVELYNLIGTYFVPYVNDNYFDIGNNDDDYNYGNVFGLLGGAFTGITSILAITIIPGITIGVLLFIPLIIMIILFIVHLFKR